MITEIAFAFGVFALVIVIIWLTRRKRFKKDREPAYKPEPLTTTSEQHEEDLSIEDSEGDGLMSEGGIMFPPDPDEDS